MSRAKILLAEDDFYSAKLIYDLLNAHGYTVVNIKDGITVLSEVKKTNFDLVLLDLRLPGKNGFMVAEHLRRSSYAASIPIIVISAFADQQNKLRAYQAGANFFLNKPINTEELLLIIGNLLKQQHEKTMVLQSNINSIIEAQIGRIGHTEKVIELCEQLAKLKDINSVDKDLLLKAASLHDIGLINFKKQEDHVKSSVRIAEAMGIEEDIITLINFHHDSTESELSKVPSRLIPLIHIIQIAEKTEEVYCTSPIIFQKDLENKIITQPFVAYIKQYINALT